HPAFAGKLLPGWDFVDNDPNPMEIAGSAYGHGTHVSGIITRVAPNAKIIPIRVLDSTGSTNAWVLAEALAFAANPDGNPATDDGADVVNLSMGSPTPTRLLHDFLQSSSSDLAQPTDVDFPQIGKPNLIVVAAGGNNGGDFKIYPGAETSIDGLITVGASDITDHLAPYSNYGSWIKVAAPGDRIISTTPDGGYGAWSGTSMSAPVVSGIVALIKQRFPGLAPLTTKDQVRCTTVRIDAKTTKQRVDAFNAVTTIPKVGGCGGN
ncbi:MAG TPA: S8 family serine peptidase, partial [Pyrinomonadaceae bacterium]|nr:S8 family serine peptidase [Pyrinomonadaceae bacterium]